MRSLLTLLTLLCTTSALWAQELKIEADPSAAAALERIERYEKPTEVKGYRVGIFFDNGQDARTKATEARDLFLNNFASQKVYMVYESPYYKVSAGDCLTEEEAIMLFERIRQVFPDAYVMRENMKITDFIEIPQSPENPESPTEEQPLL